MYFVCFLVVFFLGFFGIFRLIFLFDIDVELFMDDVFYVLILVFVEFLFGGGGRFVIIFILFCYL